MLVYSIAQLCVVDQIGSMFRLATIATLGNATGFAFGSLKELDYLVWIMIGLILAVLIAMEILIAKKYIPLPPPLLTKKRKRFLVIKAVSSAAVFILCTVYTVMYTPNISENDKARYEFISSTNTAFGDTNIYIFILHDITVDITQKYFPLENLEDIDEYFDSKEALSENDMTGIFEGKNLLVVQLESFSTEVLNEDVCPNIYSLLSDSIYFENYYGIMSGDEPTFDNEFAVNTGLYAFSGYTASKKIIGKSFSDSLANTFSSYGYSANVYHANDSEFYSRGESELAYGYEKYNSLPEMTDEDLDWIDDLNIANCDDTYEAITGGEKYLSYVLTISAHMPYDTGELGFAQGDRYNIYLSRHSESYVDESDEMKLYKAYATLTDDFVGRLIERMDADGRLDDTVILFVSDHYAYGLYDDVSGKELIDVQNIPCFIYAKGTQAQTVEKVCSNIDLLPTLINLFGFETNAKYMGSDIFDDNYEGIAYLPSGDWITSKCMYYDGSIVESYTDEEITDEYTDGMNDFVTKQLRINSLILYSEYFTGEYSDND
ncbi:MAG: LTA synthase family protein [Ruminococcus sp.]|nr:LTA synthase family protein [Ruminococcus sp.]